ncbi:MAG: amidohydrolase family protein [Candidatus Bathyarchaeota archaeon]|jgi:dihydroorotase (multifunctional complex type)
MVGRVDLVVKNSRLVTSQGVLEGGVAIDEGVIVTLAKDPHLPVGDRVIDAGGNVVLPGVLDGHSHTTLPPEDSASGTRAAAKGGITTLLEMPGTQIGCFNPGEFKEKRDLYEATSYIDFCIHAGCASGYPGGTLTEMWGMGATGVKFFVSNAGPDWPQTYDGEIIQCFKELARIRGLALIHAENDQILVDNKKMLEAGGRRDYGAHLEWRPPIAEAECGERIIRYLGATGCRGLIVHTSLPKTVLNALEARRRGVEVHVETCPQYLYLTEEDVREKGPWAKFAPPARGKETVAEMWGLLEAGLIETVATDHAPYSYESKEAGLDDIMAAPNGIPGLETFLPLLITGVNRGRLSLERLAATVSENPAKLYGVYPQKGSFLPGSDGDLTIIDVRREWRISNDDLVTACGWTPYEGYRTMGAAMDAFVRGEAVLEDGEVVSAPGFGTYVSRSD